MHLLDLPLEAFVEERIGTAFRSALVSAFPDVEFTQTSDCLADRFRQVAAVSADEATIDAILATIPTSRFIATCADLKDAQDCRRRLSTAHPRFIEDAPLKDAAKKVIRDIQTEKREPTKDERALLSSLLARRQELRAITLDEHFAAPKRDWLGLFRPATEKFEREEAARRRLDIQMALSAYTSDSCAGTNGDEVNGRACNLAGGGSNADTLTVTGGNGELNVQSNQFQPVVTKNPFMHDSTAPPTGAQRLTTKLTSNPVSTATYLCVLWSDDSNYYASIYGFGANPITRLFKVVAGGFTQLGSTATSSWVQNDIGGCEWGAGSVGSLVNGSYVVAPVADGAFTTGVWGINSANSSACTVDDILWETEAAAAANADQLVGSGLVSTGTLRGGLVR